MKLIDDAFDDSDSRLWGSIPNVEGIGDGVTNALAGK